MQGPRQNRGLKDMLLYKGQPFGKGGFVCLFCRLKFLVFR